MKKRAHKSRSRHRAKKADDTKVQVRDCGVGTSRSDIITDEQQAQEPNPKEDLRASLGISTRADFRAVIDGADSPLPRNCAETHLGTRSETPADKVGISTKNFLPEIVGSFNPLSWDDRLDEFCGESTLDDVEYVRHSKRGIAFTQYVGNNRPSYLPRIFSDGARQFIAPRRPHHLPRLHSDGVIERRGTGKPRPKVPKTGLTREQSVQHRSGGEFIENVRHATVQGKLDLERRHLQKTTRRIRELDEHASRSDVSDNVEPIAGVSNPESPETNARDRVQEVIVKQNRLRKQQFLRAMEKYMKKHSIND